MNVPFIIRSDVALDKLSAEHAAAMCSWMCQSEVRLNIGLRGEPSLSAALEWIDRASHDPTMKTFTIMLDGHYVGNVVIDKIDQYLKVGRLSVYVGDANARNMGVGSTAIYLTLVEAFGNLGLHKVWLVVHCRNARAISTYMKLGFSIEGVLRDEFLIDGERRSVFYMGLLHHELPSPKGASSS